MRHLLHEFHIEIHALQIGTAGNLVIRYTRSDLSDWSQLVLNHASSCADRVPILR
jgi:hypothetical protein